MVVDIVPRHSCVQEIYLIPSSLNGVVLQHGCYGAIEALTILPYGRDLFGLLGVKPEASDFDAFGIVADCLFGKGTCPVGIFDFVANTFFGEVMDADEGCGAAE